MAQRYELDVALDSSGVEQGAQSAMNALSGLAGQAGIVNTALRAAGAAAVAFAGAQGIGAAISSAATFEKQMLSLRSTVGESAQTVKSMRDNVMELSAETGESTKQIVDGFRFARSAGLRMAKAQELVETSTKASAAGFGEQNELVRTATTAMNTWSSEVESGSDFLNTMAAAAQNADIRVSEMSGAFRRNVNIASQLGLELEETLGSLSAISGAVGSASRGGRLFQQVLAGLLKPTQQASDVISSAVGSVDNLHESIREGGLVQALLQLQQSLNRNDKEMSDVFRSTRRLEGALALIANEGERARDITSQAAEATNTIGKAFKNTEGTAREWRKTQQRFNNLLVNLGNDLLPTVNTTLEIARDRIDRFSQGVEGASKAWSAFRNLFASDFISADLQAASEELRTINDSLESITGAGANNPGGGRPLQATDAEAIAGRVETINEDLVQAGASEELLSTVNENIRQAILPGGTRQEILNRIGTFINQIEGKINQELVDGADVGLLESGVFEDPFANAAGTGDFGFGNVLEEEAERSTRQGITSGMDQAIEEMNRVDDMVQSVSPESLSTQYAAGTMFAPHNLGLDLAKEEMEDLGDQSEETFNKMESLSRNWGRSFSRTTAEMLATGEANFKKLGQTFIQDFLEVIVQRMVTNRALNFLLRGSMSGPSEKGFLKTGVNFLGGFFDTPGVQQVGPQGGTASFAPGDKFVAGKSEKSMREQLSGGASGGTTVHQSVENNFPTVSDQQIDRRIQKAAPRIAEQAKRETLNALRGGGSDAQVARNA